MVKRSGGRTKKVVGDECGCGGGLLGPNASKVLNHDSSENIQGGGPAPGCGSGSARQRGACGAGEGEP